MSFFRLQNAGGAYGGGAGGGMGNNVPVEALPGAAYGGNNGIFYPHAAVAQQQQQAMMQQVQICVGRLVWCSLLLRLSCVRRDDNSAAKLCTLLSCRGLLDTYRIALTA